MTEKEVLADLRAIFGAAKSVLYADELAQVLGRPSAGSIYSLISRGGIPVPVLEVGGRPCVSIHAVAAWLAGEGVKPNTKATPSGAPAVQKPKRKHESVGHLLRAVRVQQDFLSEFVAQLESIDMRGLIDENEEHNGGETL